MLVEALIYVAIHWFKTKTETNAFSISLKVDAKLLISMRMGSLNLVLSFFIQEYCHEWSN